VCGDAVFCMGVRNGDLRSFITVFQIFAHVSKVHCFHFILHVRFGRLFKGNF
jgi:hypothetical protein